MSKGFGTRKIPQVGLDLLKDTDFSVWEEDRVIPRDILLERVKGAQAVLSLLTDKMDGELMEAAGPQLKIISNYAVGFDNIDVTEATKRKIYVSNTPGVLTEAVAEQAFALMLSIARRIPESDQFTKPGKHEGWDPGL